MTNAVLIVLVLVLAINFELFTLQLIYPSKPMSASLGGVAFDSGSSAISAFRRSSAAAAKLLPPERLVVVVLYSRDPQTRSHPDREMLGNCQRPHLWLLPPLSGTTTIGQDRVPCVEHRGTGAAAADSVWTHTPLLPKNDVINTPFGRDPGRSG